MCALKQVMQDFITLTHLVFQIPVVCRPLGHLCSSNHHHRLYPIHHLCTLQLCPRRVMSHQPDECHHEYNLLSKQISQCSTFSISSLREVQPENQTMSMDRTISCVHAVGKSIWLESKRLRFDSWLDLHTFFLPCAYYILDHESYN